MRNKADGSLLVSSADMASQRVIQGILEVSKLPVLSEESAAPSHQDGPDWDTVLAGGPLDGTESFLRSRSGFAVNIALCDETGPIYGVVADPLSNRMYHGGMGVSGAAFALGRHAHRQYIRLPSNARTGL